MAWTSRAEVSTLASRSRTWVNPADRVEIELLAPGPRAPSVRAAFNGANTPRVALHELGVNRHRGALAAGEGERGAHERTVGRIASAGWWWPWARPVEAVPGAAMFRGPVSAGAVEHALRCERVVLTAPDAAWRLPPVRAGAALGASGAYDRHAGAAPAGGVR